MAEFALSLVSIIFLIQLAVGKTRLNKVGFFGLALFLAAIFSMLGFGIYQSWLQYDLWKNNEIGKLLLPPYQTFDYYIFFIRTRIFNPYLLSLFFGLLFLSAARYLNSKYEERFFERIEPCLLGISIFLVGHPGWLAYIFIFLPLLFFAGILITNYNLSVANKEAPRVSLYYLWLPAALFTIIVSRWLVDLSWWQLLKL